MENILEPDRPRMTIWRMRIAFWIPKTANTQSQYVILGAYPLQQWLYEGASVLHYTSFIVIFVEHMKKDKAWRESGRKVEIMFELVFHNMP